MGFLIPSQYGYVLAAATSTCIVGWIHSHLSTKWRNLSGVKYPNAYATDEAAAKDVKAATFNCAQRAHANFTENHGPFLALLTVAGLQHSTLAAYLGFGWTVARIGYVYGYVYGGPPGRHPWFTISSVIAVMTAGLAGHACYRIITVA